MFITRSRDDISRDFYESGAFFHKGTDIADIKNTARGAAYDRWIKHKRTVQARGRDKTDKRMKNASIDKTAFPCMDIVKSITDPDSDAAFHQHKNLQFIMPVCGNISGNEFMDIASVCNQIEEISFLFREFLLVDIGFHPVCITYHKKSPCRFCYSIHRYFYSSNCVSDCIIKENTDVCFTDGD